MLGTDREQIFSIVLQNVMQPKNSNRTEAIKNGNYKEILTPEEAREFIASQMQTHLKNELLSIETECKNKVASL